MRWNSLLTLVLIGTLLGTFYLQSRIWSSKEGYPYYLSLQEQIQVKSKELTDLQQTNRLLAREVSALRDEPEKIEFIAREELGYVKPGEQWVRVLQSPASAPSPQTVQKSVNP
jgi:cell division protein FtsB